MTTEDLVERVKAAEKRINDVERRMNENDTRYAIISTKLSAILWGIGVIGSTLIGVLIKILFKT